MQIRYSPDADVLIIELRKGEPVDSVDIEEGIIAHFDQHGKVIEIEILDASKLVDIGELTFKGLEMAKAQVLK